MSAAASQHGPWRDRVLERSLSDATALSISRAEALLQATLELLERSGEDVTVQAIADRAGLSLRVLYRHFPSKDALLIALLEDLLAKRAEATRARLDSVDDPIERLVLFVLNTIDLPISPANTALAKNTFLLSASRPEEVRRAQEPMAALATDLVRSAGSAGLIDPDVAPRGAYLLLELRRTYNHSRFFGSELGLEIPTPDHLVRYSLRALGVDDSIAEPAVLAGMAAQ